MTVTNQDGKVSQSIEHLLSSSNNFTRLENDGCSREFSQQFVSDWTAVILVLNSTEKRGIYEFTKSASAKGFNTNPFFCESNGAVSDCDKPGALNRMGNWTYPYVINTTYPYSVNCHAQPQGVVLPPSANTNSTLCENYPPSLQYCLGQPTDSQSCRAEISLIFLSIVAFCNAIKATCLFLLLRLSSFQPLITMGDAISSFLAYPDPKTATKGALMHRKSEADLVADPSWRPARIRWFYGMDSSRWAIGAWLIAGFWLLTLSFLTANVVGRKNAGYQSNSIWSVGFGTVDAGYLVHGTINAPILANALIVNLPQLMLSVVYVICNTLLTSMLRSAEYSSFSLRRQSLRVSEPTGIQRSTYWLQLPFRYATPLIVVSGVLHWVVSESVFLVNITVTGNAPGSSTSACGWSEAALICVLILLGLAVAILLGIAFFRRYPPGLVAEDLGSMAISKRCHPPCGMEDTTRFRVKFGFVEREQGDGKGRLGFSTGTVETLREEDVFVYDEPMEEVDAGYLLYRASRWGISMPRNTGVSRHRLRSNP